MRRGKVGLTLGESEEELPARARCSALSARAGGCRRASRSAWTGVAACLGAGDPRGGWAAASKRLGHIE